MEDKKQRRIEYSKKSIIRAVAFTTLFVLAMYSLRREWSLVSETTRWWFGVDIILFALTAIRINMNEKIQQWFARALFLVAPVYAFCVVEWVMKNIAIIMSPCMLILNYFLFLCIFIVLQILLNNIRVSLSMGMILCLVFAIADSFVGKFRGMVIRTADIYAIKTAINVGGTYELVFDWYMVIGILMTIAFILVVFRCQYKEVSMKKRCIKAIIGILFVVSFSTVVFNKTFLNKHDATPYAWGEWQSIKDHGALWDVIAGIPFLKLEEPEGYSKKEAQESIETVEKITGSKLQSENDFNGRKPNIIMIMNESFSDLENFGTGLTTETEILPFFNSLTENTIRGEIVVPTYGGGTCNTEFEALTGCTMSFLPDGIFPFVSYIKDGMENIGGILNGEYETFFSHPFKSTGWNRNNVYPLFGFDNLLFDEGYSEKQYIRSYVSDESDYERLIENYEAAISEEKNIFMFNVTIQNHGSYNYEPFENTMIVGMEHQYPLAEQYLSLAKESDNALKKLVEYFESREEPVIICMFGDHYPAVEEELYDVLLENVEVEGTELKLLKYRTPFIIWSNYDIEEKNNMILSANYLSTLLLETAELPVTSYQNYLLKLYEVWPVISRYGVMDAAGTWCSWKEVESDEMIAGYEKVQYYNFFDKK